MTATERLLAFATAEHSLPAATRAAATRLLADTLAVGAAGAASDEAVQLRQALQSGRGPARMLGTGKRSYAETAAMWNGFAIHCLEWDAVHEPAVVHAMSVVTAALFAVIDEAGGADEEDALTALALGVDIASGLGVAATGAMRFFRPATAGIMGASLAAARIAGMPAARFANVLGLAYSQAAGTMQAHVEASVALPLQVAFAARAAVTAVHLAQTGLGGPHDVLEGPFGYSALIEELDLSRYRPGARWLIEEVSVKPFPSGRASHGVLGEVEQLIAEGAVNSETVTGVEAFVPPLIHRLIGRPYKADMEPGYARLCLAFLVPLMLRDGVIDPRKVDAATVRDPAIAALAPNVRVTLDENPDPNALAPQRLVIDLYGGGRIEREIGVNLGSPARPMSARQTAAKLALARSCANPESDPRIFDDPLSYFCGDRT